MVPKIIKRLLLVNNLYKSYDMNIKACKTDCDKLGDEFSKVWIIQEKIKVQTTSLEEN